MNILAPNLPNFFLLSSFLLSIKIFLVVSCVFQQETFSRATYPNRSWSEYPAPVHPCIASLLHRLISYQWWQVHHPQSLCQQQGCLPWFFLPCCVLMWLQSMQRTWHFLHKPCATRNPAQVLSCGRHRWLPRRWCSSKEEVNQYNNRVADKQRS